MGTSTQLSFTHDLIVFCNTQCPKNVTLIKLVSNNPVFFCASSCLAFHKLFAVIPIYGLRERSVASHREPKHTQTVYHFDPSSPGSWLFFLFFFFVFWSGALFCLPSVSLARIKSFWICFLIFWVMFWPWSFHKKLKFCHWLAHVV